MPKIIRTGKFNQSLDELILNDLALESLINKRIRWFQINPNDTRLNNHALTKRLAGQYAFSITNNIRIKYEWTSKTTVRLLEIGPHEQVYARVKKQSPKR